MSLRVRCLDCYRPEGHCLCSTITSIEHKTDILILQHPRERDHPFNTARLAERSLRRAKLMVNHSKKLSADPALAGELEGCGLLYPRPGANDLSQLPPEERTKKLVVIDGTWHHARGMYRDIPQLQDLPHYTLPAGEVSGFKIRKQPKEYCLSTLEAIHSALTCLEPETPDLDSLLRPFKAMQRIQLESMHSPNPRAKRKRDKTKLVPHLPAALVENFPSLVVAYGEVCPIRCEDIRPFRGPRPLLTFAAERPATGERIEATLEHPADSLFQPNEEACGFLRLSPEQDANRTSVKELQARWAKFTKPGDTLAVWNRGTFAYIQTALPNIPRRLLLKSAYCNLRPTRGMLEEIVLAEGLLSAEELEHNQTQECRTHERLANATAVARLLSRLGAKFAEERKGETAAIDSGLLQ